MKEFFGIVLMIAGGIPIFLISAEELKSFLIAPIGVKPDFSSDIPGFIG